MLYGAILGDVIGSVYEFDRGNKTREFPLFTDYSNFTDDTVMTIAVADALLEYFKRVNVEKEVVYKDILIDSMKRWGKRYPNAGYGVRFYNWVLGDDHKPYNSWGNGSAMRTSAVAWAFDKEDVKDMLKTAEITAAVTHNHPEGIKGALATVEMIQRARDVKSMEDLKLTAMKYYGSLKNLDEIRPTYHHQEDCMNTLPQALECFLESNDFESCIRNVMYIGGDTDTLGAIAGAIAEAYYGISEELIKECRRRLPEDMLAVIDEFEEYFK